MANCNQLTSLPFKGLRRMLQKVEQGCDRLVTASGGNAGMAAAYAARHLGVPITVYVSKSISQRINDRLVTEVGRYTFSFHSVLLLPRSDSASFNATTTRSVFLYAHFFKGLYTHVVVILALLSHVRKYCQADLMECVFLQCRYFNLMV